jgi:hypothetical protein
MKLKINFSKNYNFFLIIVFLFGIIFFVHTASSKKAQVAPQFSPSIPEFSSSILEVDRYPRAFNPETGKLLFSVLNKDNNRLNLVDYEFMGLNSLISHRSQRDLRSADLDNDGILDVISNVYGAAGCFDIKKGIVTKDAKLKFAESKFKLWNQNKESEITCIGGFAETLSIADYDGDGLIDILQTAYERIYLFKNLGNFEFEDVTPDFLILNDKYPRVEGAAFVDINADGHVDILVSDVIALNNGDGTFNNLALPESYKIADEGILPVDLDNDKYFEIVKLDPSGFLYIYKFAENNTLHLIKKINLSEFLSTKIIHSLFGISSADFNSDGCEDLVIAGGKPHSYGPILLINDCKLNFLPLITSNINGFFSGPVLAGDFNDDGKPDIINQIHPIYPPIIKLSSKFNTIPLNHEIGTGKTLILTNMFENENNFKLTFSSKNGGHNLFGHTFFVTGSNHNESNLINKIFFIDGGSGYMQQGSYSKLMYLDPKQCPYSISINISNITDSYMLACDGTYSRKTNEKTSSNVNLRIEGSFEKNEKNIIVNSNFLLDNYGWSLGDSAIVEKDSGGGGIQLKNGKDNSWSYVSTMLPTLKGKRYKIIVKAQSISTQPSIRLGLGREWTYIKGEQINDRFEFTFDALDSNSLTLDIFNASPGKGLKSLIKEIKVIQE